MGVAMLIITDGSTTVDLLATGYGYHLADWAQAITGYKGGGTVQDSPLADGRRLVDKKFVDGIEVFTLALNQSNQDALADDIQDLLRLLEQATDYWSDWYDTPVYIECKWTNETNTRYAIVKNYQLGNLPNPFGQPFLQANCEAVYREFTLTIERGPWTSNTPGTGTGTAAAASETYDGRTLGNVDSSGTADPSTARDVFVGNKHNVANLTDIYNYDDSLTSFSSNLLDAALPTTLFPGTPAVNDIVYFGIDTSVSNSGPFSSLVFDIGTAANYNATLTWEYYNGSWTALTVIMITSTAITQSSTTYFQNNQVTTVSWKQPSDWTTVAINGVTAYWVRVRISVFTGWTTNPTQQNRDIYSVPWGYTRITSDQVPGDLPALARFFFSQRNGDLAPGGNQISAHRVIVGLRSESRGANFTPFLNCADEQNPTGVSVTAKTNTIVQADTTTPTGRRYRYGPVATEAMATRLIIGMVGGSTGAAQQYAGTFRVFLRAQQVGGAAGDMEVRIGLDTIGTGNTDNIIFFTPTLSFTNADQQELLDFGLISLPGIPSSIVGDSATYASSFLRIQASSVDATPVLYFYDLILMPVDEWAGEFLDPLSAASTALTDEQGLEVDSIIIPKVTTRSFVRADIGLSDDIIAVWQNITNGPAILQANANQRLWFLAAHKLNSAWYADFEILSYVRLFRNQRYFSARGDR